MDRIEFPDEVRALVEQFDEAHQTTTLLRARFRSGKSGAFVGLVDCQGTHDGVFVLKIASGLAGEHEKQRHLRALELQVFQKKIPELIDSFQAQESYLLLLQIAGRSRIDWRPLVESLHIFASGYKALVKALWSPAHFSLGEQEQGKTLVPDLLGYRLTVGRGRIVHHARAFLGSDTATARAFHHLGEVLPNPLHFALELSQYTVPLFRPLTGPCHGDCHAANPIVAAGHDGTVRDINLIDLASFSEKAPFFYDTSYLELATLLRQMDGIGQEVAECDLRACPAE